VVDLLDYDVRYGQGFLFAAPKPLRADAGPAGVSDQVAMGHDTKQETKQDARQDAAADPKRNGAAAPAQPATPARGNPAPRTEPARTVGSAALLRRAAGPT
jgi:cyclic-di-GMP phosphodiesterase, flagellum assembly factor TipF